MSHPVPRPLLATVGVVLVLLPGPCAEGTPTTLTPQQDLTPSKLAAAAAERPEASPAQSRIAAARAAIQAHPDQPQGHSDLALALARRARETSDAEFYERAEAALKESFRLARDNPEAERVEVWILLGKHDFAQALEKARALNKRIPDDTMVYALLADAAVELGRYEEAEKAVQWSFDLRPGEISGLTRGAFLRELFGDLEGAIELMRSAYEKTAITEAEDRAWILTQIAHLELLSGRPEIADQILVEALKIFPRYHYSLAQMASVRTAQGRFHEAVALCEEHYLVSPVAESLFQLAVAHQRAGHAEAAAAAFRQFEKRAIEESSGVHNHNRELATYYGDHARRPAEALRFAAMEATRRQDLNTLDALAWALHLNGRSAEAQQTMQKVLAVGVRDPVVFYHAGMIAAGAGDTAAATRHLEASLAQAPRSDAAVSARQALVRLAPPPPPKQQ
jgi:tetratricopeptide (TPR) repeat protein